VITFSHLSRNWSRPCASSTLVLANVSGIQRGIAAVPEALVVLVVEDEWLLHAPIEEALVTGGFKPVFVGSGEEASSLLRSVSNYSALVTDVTLRDEMRGWQLATLAREINPELPVVYMTAASAAEWAAYGVPNSILLQKPFAPAQLVTAVSQLLNKNTPAT
jgi:DNA-binding response OmpR family regulator